MNFKRMMKKAKTNDRFVWKTKGVEKPLGEVMFNENGILFLMAVSTDDNGIMEYIRDLEVIPMSINFDTDYFEEVHTFDSTSK